MTNPSAKSKRRLFCGRPVRGVGIITCSLLLLSCSLPESITVARRAVASLSPNNEASPEKPEKADPASLIDQILDRGELRVVTRPSATTYYLDGRSRPAGPDYELASAFARDLGVGVRFVFADTEESVYGLLANGEADMAAAGLAATLTRKASFLFSTPLATTRQKVVCRRHARGAKDPAELQQVDLHISTDLDSAETLWLMQANHRDLRWTAHENSTQEAMLYRVWQKSSECTITHAHVLRAAQRIMPELRAMFDVGEPQALAWATLPGDASLVDAINSWVRGAGADRVAGVRDRYFPTHASIDYVDTRVLIRRLESRYPQYKNLLRRAAEAHDLDSPLLAALSYQESHWNPHATSPTGVRGLMMLTRDTARALGVSNRLDPAQAVPAGARYLAHLRETFSDAIPQADRTYMALAAYNIGRARIQAAQSLARRQGKNPNSWAELKLVLPQLCRSVKGICRGHRSNLGAEAVRYVERIRYYREVIAANTQSALTLAYSDLR